MTITKINDDRFQIGDQFFTLAQLLDLRNNTFLDRERKEVDIEEFEPSEVLTEEQNDEAFEALHALHDLAVASLADYDAFFEANGITPISN